MDAIETDYVADHLDAWNLVPENYDCFLQLTSVICHFLIFCLWRMSSALEVIHEVDFLDVMFVHQQAERLNRVRPHGWFSNGF